MRVLVTGAAGYAGRGMTEILANTHQVRSLDLRPAAEAMESVVGDVTDLALCRSALVDMEAVVLCHLAPNPYQYSEPGTPLDVNVKGAANLYYGAMELGITRFVLISTTGVLRREEGLGAVPGEGPYNFRYNFYALTKIMQEDLARFYYEKHGVSTIVLRPGWIVYDEDFITKYGQKLERYDPGLIDPRDIGKAVCACLALTDPGLEAYEIGQDDCGLDLAPARARLGWNPKYRFVGLRRRD